MLDFDDLLERKRELEKALVENVDRSIKLLSQLRNETSDFENFRKSQLMNTFKLALNHENEGIKMLAKNVIEIWKNKLKNSKQNKVTSGANSLMKESCKMSLRNIEHSSIMVETAVRARTRDIIFQKLKAHAETDVDEDKLKNLANQIEGGIYEMESELKDYQCHCLMLFTNLRDVKETTKALLDGSLTTDAYVHMDATALMPQHFREHMEDWRHSALLMCTVPDLTLSNSSDYKCPQCSTSDSSYFEKQIDSGDEPMTVFLTCNACRHKWRV